MPNNELELSIGKIEEYTYLFKVKVNEYIAKLII